MAEQHSHDHSHDHTHNHPPPTENHSQASSTPLDAWKTSGVRVIPSNSLSPVTGQQHATPGMSRMSAIDFARVGAQKLWAGTVSIHANAKTGAHHHGHLESVIYVLQGRARMRWGEKLEFTAEAGPGDFIYVPPYVPHQEINASADERLECVLVRSDSEAIAVNLPNVEPVERPELVKVCFLFFFLFFFFFCFSSSIFNGVGRDDDDDDDADVLLLLQWIDPTHPE